MIRFPESLLIVGCGNMAGAILKGWIAAGLEPERVTIIDPAGRDLPKGVRHFTGFDADIGAPEFVLLGFKPQMLADIAPSLQSLDLDGALSLSILAGTQLETLQASLPDIRQHVRMMPNLAVSIGKSVNALYAKDLPDTDRAMLDGMGAALGSVLWLEREEQMHAFTALAGSGPAFVFRFVEALAKAAQEQGFDAQQASRMALDMTEGAAILAASADIGPGALADRVASPGGTTRAGLNVLDEGDAIFRLVQDTLDAAARRSREMADEG